MRNVLAILLLITAPAAADPIAGRATVVDGDTLAIEGLDARVRLHGIDTPEGKQTCRDAAGQRYLCGSRAAQALADLIGRNGRVACEERDRDRYGRIVAVCTGASGELNAALVAAGWALAYRQYGGDAYADEEAEARAARRGLWSGTFTPPWEWRRNGDADEPPRVAAGQCAIKGNIGAGGDRIYHLPGGRSYGKTRIDVEAGERMFCSEEEAVAAGWRRAKR